MTLSEAPESRVEGPFANKIMSWHVYIARARTGRYYTGITTDPQERIAEHNNGKGSRFAVHQGPFVLAYVSEAFPGKSEARKREWQIKRWTRGKKEKLIQGEWK
jgi:putative endonuclease